MSKAEQIFPNMLVTAFIPTLSLKEVTFLQSLASEQNFCATIINVDMIKRIKVDENKTLVAINFPYVGLGTEAIISSIKETENSAPNLKGYLISLSKLDIENRKWKNIKKFIEECKNHTSKPIHLGIDPAWMTQSNQLLRFFSIVNSYKDVFPVIINKDLAENTKAADLLNWAKISKKSSIAPVSYFGSNSMQPDFLLALLNTGFDKIGIGGESAKEISKRF